MTSWRRLSRLVHDDIERILLGEAEIRTGIERAATELQDAYRSVGAGGEGPTVVAVLKGSVVFVADLIRLLPFPLRLSFLWAESYREGTSSGPLTLGALGELEDLRGRRVLLVDDILDSGRTLSAIRAELTARGASEVRTCVFLDKPARRAVALEPDHAVFTIEDRFVVGYGLDFAGRYRNLPYVGILRPEVLAARASRAQAEARRE